MLAARLHEGENTLSIENIEQPDIGATDVLVEVCSASICGSDVHHLSGELPIDDEQRPVTLGHEGAGVVAEVGSEVTHLEPGDHVIINYVISCGNCDPCLRGNDNRCRNRKSIGSDVDGTFAEYIAIPARSAIRMPDTVPFEWGSIAGCAVATAYHAIRRSGIEHGNDVVVFGTGGVGLHAVLFASISLTQTVIAVDPIVSSLATAREYGADVTINPEKENVLKRIENVTGSRGVDVALECSGSPVALKQAIDAINGNNRFASGTAVSVGYQDKPFEGTYWGLREGQLLVSGDHTRLELRQLVSLLNTKEFNLDRSIATAIDLEDIGEGIDLVGEKETLTGRVVIDMD